MAGKDDAPGGNTVKFRYHCSVWENQQVSGWAGERDLGGTCMVMGTQIVGACPSESVGLRRRGGLSCVAWGHEESEERTPREDFLEEREPRHPRGQGQVSQGH